MLSRRWEPAAAAQPSGTQILDRHLENRRKGGESLGRRAPAAAFDGCEIGAGEARLFGEQRNREAAVLTKYSYRIVARAEPLHDCRRQCFFCTRRGVGRPCLEVLKLLEQTINVRSAVSDGVPVSAIGRGLTIIGRLLRGAQPRRPRPPNGPFSAERSGVASQCESLRGPDPLDGQSSQVRPVARSDVPMVSGRLVQLAIGCLARQHAPCSAA